VKEIVPIKMINSKHKKVKEKEKSKKKNKYVYLTPRFLETPNLLDVSCLF
jgi:hypothetical protein